MSKDVSINEQFLTAVHKKDIAEMDRLLSEGADIESLNINKETPFFHAITNHSIPVAQWLASKGANVNAVNKIGNSALIKIIDQRDPDALEAILALNPDVNIKNNRGSNALLQATILKNKELIETFLGMGVDPNITSNSLTSPLAAAVARGFLPGMELLMAAGADVNQVDDLGASVLQTAIRAQDGAGAKTARDFLLKAEELGMDVDIGYKARSGATAMSVAADTRNVEVMSVLLDMGADPNVVSSNGLNNKITPLMMAAAIKGSVEVVRKALERGANVNATDSDGNSVLFYASNSLQKGILELLIQNGLDLTVATGKQGLTPIHAILLMGGKVEDLSEIIQMGYLVNPPLGYDKERAYDLPLSIAITHQNMDAIKVLLDAGADVNRKSFAENSAIHNWAAMRMSEKEKIGMLLFDKQKGATAEKVKEQSDALIEKVAQRKVAVLEQLVQSGCFVNAAGANGITPLMVLVGESDVENVKRLVESYGADILQKDAFEDNALTLALKVGHNELFEYLLSSVSKEQENNVANQSILNAVFSSPEGWERRKNFLQTLLEVDISQDILDFQDEDGNTALIVAAATNQEDVIEVLIKKGVLVNQVNHDNESALMHAVLQENVTTITMLREAGADMTQKTLDGKTAMDLAIGTYAPHVKEAMQDAPVSTKKNSM